MRMSHQGFGPSGTAANGGMILNQSMVVTHNDLNNSLDFANGISGVPRSGNQSMLQKGSAKQMVNTSFDASKSANTLNYANTAYMSAIPIHSGTQNLAHGASNKLSKVGLKHGGQNSRTNSFHPQTNYSDGANIFVNQNQQRG